MRRKRIEAIFGSLSCSLPSRTCYFLSACRRCQSFLLLCLLRSFPLTQGPQNILAVLDFAQEIPNFLEFFRALIRCRVVTVLGSEVEQLSNRVGGKSEGGIDESESLTQ